MHCFQSWPPDHVTCIATLPGIALSALLVSIELVSLSARVASVKFYKPLLRTPGPIDRTRDTWVQYKFKYINSGVCRLDAGPDGIQQILGVKKKYYSAILQSNTGEIYLLEYAIP